MERKDVNEDYMGGYEHSRSGIRFLGRGRSGGNNDYSNLDRHSDNRSNDHRNGKGAVTRGNNESESALTHPPTDLRRRASFLSGPPDMVCCVCALCVVS